MTETIWLLVAAYVTLGVLVLALNIRSGWPLWIRLACIVLVSSLYFVTWQSLQDLRGWPARIALPHQFLINSFSVVEPNDSKNQAGRVFMWVTPIENDAPINTPRAFALPYDRALHGSLQQARKAMRNGDLQMGIASSASGDESRTQTGLFAPDSQRIDIQSLPEPSLPEK